MPKNRTIYPGRSGSTGPVIYCIDMPGHPFGIEDAVAGLSANVVAIAVDDWDDALTPWPAPGLYQGDADFKGEARVTLAELVGAGGPGAGAMAGAGTAAGEPAGTAVVEAAGDARAVRERAGTAREAESAPAIDGVAADELGADAMMTADSEGSAIAWIEREEGLAPSSRAICGYSLGGLFSLYAFTSCGFFDAAACLSASVWYEGWLGHLRSEGLGGIAGKYAFFSIGSEERKADPPILHCVEDNMEQCAEILRAHGCAADFVVGPGDHVHYHEERFRRGLQALDAHLR